MFSSLPAGTFYDPSRDYSYHGDYQWSSTGQAPKAWDTLDWKAGEYNQQGSWTKLLAQLGLGDTTTNKGTWALGQLGNAQGGYGAAQLDEPNLQWQDYEKTIDLDKLWASMSAQNRGENMSQYTDARFLRRQ